MDENTREEEYAGKQWILGLNLDLHVKNSKYKEEILKERLKK